MTRPHLQPSDWQKAAFETGLIDTMAGRAEQDLSRWSDHMKAAYRDGYAIGAAADVATPAEEAS